MNPIVELAATSTVSVAGAGFALQVMSLEVTYVTGELVGGKRTAAVDVASPAIKVVQMSVESLQVNKIKKAHTETSDLQ